MSSASPGPVLGPYEAWITGEDVAACCGGTPEGGTGEMDGVALDASMVMFELSGRQFTGSGERVVRPCAQKCGCWGAGARSFGLNWAWSVGGPWGAWWVNEQGDSCGCQPLSTVRLSGYPVTEIVEVLIDGAVVDPDTYRLDGWRRLVRMNDPGPPVKPRFWPGCQNLGLNSDQPGTFEVTYLSGVQPPQTGRDAAAELACQLWKQCSGDVCLIPAGATKVVRQGIEVDKVALGSWFQPGVSTGMLKVDTFLAAYWKRGGGRRPAFWSPDAQGYARSLGS